MPRRNERVYNSYNRSALKEAGFSFQKNMSLLYSLVSHSGKIFSKINHSRSRTKGFALAIVVFYSLDLSLASAAAENLRRIPLHHGNIYGSLSLRTPEDNEKFSNYPIVPGPSEEPSVSKSALNGRRGFGQNDIPEVKSKSLHERHIDTPIVRRDTPVEAKYIVGFPDDTYYNRDNDYSSRWLNPSDYAFLFAIRLVDPEDYDDAATLQPYFS